MPPPAAALLIVGLAIASDGDTIKIDGQRIRLFGIDAPESRQLCEADNRQYACGLEATEHLRGLIAGRTIRCVQKDTDRYSRIVAVCDVEGQDVGRQMVRDGHAVAFAKYSLDYQPDERYAQAARAGLWRGTFTMPWEWRASNVGRSPK